MKLIRNLKAHFMFGISAMQYVVAKQDPAFLRQVREFLSFPLLPGKARKCVPIFDRGIGSKPTRLRQVLTRSPAV